LKKLVAEIQRKFGESNVNVTAPIWLKMLILIDYWYIYIYKDVYKIIGKNAKH
jgi:hypothetical protein